MSTPDILHAQMPAPPFATNSSSKRVLTPAPQHIQAQPMRVWHALLFVGILALSAFLNFFQLQHNGYGNLYYATAVKSMLLSWHNFFFVSFDPGGFITVDKPPVDLWLQTASAKLFGFSGFSLFLPQALAGVLAVMVLFHLVRRSFGILAGSLAALIMAITPMAVVISSDNNLDMMLVLAVLLATWAVVYAAETGKLPMLLLGAALVGVG
ncbi:MAG: ArnT family glycosyltransferase, partial [Ktedonobacteraceae bacterium]